MSRRKIKHEAPCAYELTMQNFSLGPRPEDWQPWEEQCIVQSHKLASAENHTNYRCASCHTDTSEAWSWECPNLMCAVESIFVAQGWVNNG
jgi:hypothetical protein